ncbi:BPSS1780 family membrane protein [Undibacterium sp. Di27W]|uniref:BPSS1780 family membrane protein n=1 Tax=Undibacterium sp. Di27W TaxID=3413036 RepID=UPI003BF1C152
MINSVKALSGWTWITQGAALFRRRPLELSVIFFTYIFLNMASCVLPFLPLLLAPAFSIGFLQAVRTVDLGGVVSPNLLFFGFRSRVLPKLLLLGALNFIGFLIAEMIASAVDGGALRAFVKATIATGGKLATEPPDFSLWENVFFLAYLPTIVALWYAAPLVVWQKMSAPKAVFFSFFSALRIWPTFVVFILSWLGLRMLSGLLINLIGSILGNDLMLTVIAFPISIMLIVVMYCSFYPAYTDVFGKPDDED